jgi:hypothetical protein
MASKQVTDRQKAAAAVSSTVETYEDRLQAGILSVMSESGASPEVAAAAAVLARAAKGLLATTATVMVAADETHAVELADDAGLRLARDTEAAALRKQLVDLREGLVGLYGAAAPAAVGFSGPTPDDPVLLVRVAREVAKALQREGALPAPKFKKAAIEPVEEAATLTRLADRLEAAIGAVMEDVRENQVTRTARDAAMAHYDKSFSRAANFLAALYALAGEPELADRVRPSSRSPGRLASSEGAAPPDRASPSPSPSAEEPCDPAESGG